MGQRYWSWWAWCWGKWLVFSGIAFAWDGGAGGVRTRDLLDAIEARSQLRYGPTLDAAHKLYHGRAVRSKHFAVAILLRARFSLLSSLLLCGWLDRP
jgi:hypothetical protein